MVGLVSHFTRAATAVGGALEDIAMDTVMDIDMDITEVTLMDMPQGVELAIEQVIIHKDHRQDQQMHIRIGHQVLKILE